MNKHQQVRKCKSQDCYRAAHAPNGLCRHHAEGRKVRQARSALQANCRGCNNKLSLARTEEGFTYCVRCEGVPEPTPAKTVEVEVDKLRELLDYAKDYAEPISGDVFEYFDKLLEDK